MKIVQLAKVACDTGACPTIFATDRGTVLVQGYIPGAGAVLPNVPDGEFMVEIPRGLLLDGAVAAQQQ